uniref:Uncharacterized protein n=1 Tax=Zea mays TaxID=4577 RepID=B7ZXJ0_MAIZE|nr:unknown [Zea mays]|eukprot:NP_001145814.1 uncharacterized protein LOC100279321 [Zea mays]
MPALGSAHLPLPRAVRPAERLHRTLLLPPNRAPLPWPTVVCPCSTDPFLPALCTRAAPARLGAVSPCCHNRAYCRARPAPLCALCFLAELVPARRARVQLAQLGVSLSISPRSVSSSLCVSVHGRGDAMAWRRRIRCDSRPGRGAVRAIEFARP